MLNILKTIDTLIQKYIFYKKVINGDKLRLDKVAQEFQNQMERYFGELSLIIRQMRSQQEYFSEITLRKNGLFQDCILVGQNTINCKELDLKDNKIPMCHKFPFSNGFYDNNYEIGEYFTTLLLLRLLSITPLNKLNLTLIDTDSLGKRLRLILNNDFVYNQRILTYSKEITQSLKDLADYIESLLQNQLVNYENWEEFNKDNPNALLPLKVLVIFGFDREINIESTMYLNRIVKFGIECGVLTIIVGHCETENERDRNKQELYSNIKN